MGAHLVSEDFSWCHGQVDLRRSSRGRRDRRAPAARGRPHCGCEVAPTPARGGHIRQRWGRAEASQIDQRLVQLAVLRRRSATGPSATCPASTVRSSAVVSDRPDVAADVVTTLEKARGVVTSSISIGIDDDHGFSGAAGKMASIVERPGPLDAVVVALADRPTATATEGGWERVLAEHAGDRRGGSMPTRPGPGPRPTTRPGGPTSPLSRWRTPPSRAAAAGHRRRPSSPRRPGARRTITWPPSPSAGRPRAGPPGSSPPHLVCTPTHPRPRPVRTGRRLEAGSGCAAIPGRAAASPSAGGPARVVRRHAAPDGQEVR